MNRKELDRFKWVCCNIVFEMQELRDLLGPLPISGEVLELSLRLTQIHERVDLVVKSSGTLESAVNAKANPPLFDLPPQGSESQKKTP